MEFLWFENLTTSIQSFIVAPSQATLARLFLLPRVLLVEAVRGGKRSKRAHGAQVLWAMQRWADEWLALWKELKDSSTSPHPRREIASLTDDDADLTKLKRRINNIKINMSAGRFFPVTVTSLVTHSPLTP